MGEIITPTVKDYDQLELLLQDSIMQYTGYPPNEAYKLKDFNLLAHVDFAGNYDAFIMFNSIQDNTERLQSYLNAIKHSQTKEGQAKAKKQMQMHARKLGYPYSAGLIDFKEPYEGTPTNMGEITWVVANNNAKEQNITSLISEADFALRNIGVDTVFSMQPTNAPDYLSKVGYTKLLTAAPVYAKRQSATVWYKNKD